MENQPPAQPPYETPPPAPKKGLGTGAKIGIGCGAIVLLLIIASIVLSAIYAPRLKAFAEQAQKNPTRTTATTMEKFSGGKLKIVAEDDVNKRYTLKDSAGHLTTVYWDEAKQAPITISGDFSAIPTEAPVEDTESP